MAHQNTNAVLLNNSLTNPLHVTIENRTKSNKSVVCIGLIGDFQPLPQI
jgi:hypothetical protein